jgi:DNA-directed RNA polymerase subunit RPC12/RpoP
MGAVFVLLAVGMVIAVLVVNARAQGARAAAFDALVANGIPARGLVLSVDARGTKVRRGTRRFDLRGVLFDIDVPGREPFQLQTTTAIPASLLRGVLPGASLELRLDPTNAQNLAVVGPAFGFSPVWTPASTQDLPLAIGGFSSALGVQPFALGNLGSLTGPQAAQRPLLIGVAAVVAAVGFGATIAFSASSHRPASTERESSTPQPEVIVPSGGWCRAATSCCKTVGDAAACKALQKNPSEDQCRTRFTTLSKAAAAKGLTCRLRRVLASHTLGVMGTRQVECERCGAVMAPQEDGRTYACAYCKARILVAVEAQQIAAGLRVDLSNAESFLAQLAATLSTGFAERTRVESRNDRVVLLELNLDRDVFVARRETRGLVTQHRLVVRGVALKTVTHPLDRWFELLTGALAAHANTNARAAEVLSRLTGGRR